MICYDLLEGNDIYLRDLTMADCEGNYLKWLNDSAINRYLESRLDHQTLESTQRYVLDMRESDHSYLFAIVLKGTNEHIGNIKVGPIHPHYKNAYIGYLIGEQRHWGKGFATEAIYLATKFCFAALNLHKVNAGVIAPNTGSIRALEKIGFTREATLREEVLLDGVYKDTYRYGILKREFKEFR